MITKLQVRCCGERWVVLASDDVEDGLGDRPTLCGKCQRNLSGTTLEPLASVGVTPKPAAPGASRAAYQCAMCLHFEADHRAKFHPISGLPDDRRCDKCACRWFHVEPYTAEQVETMIAHVHASSAEASRETAPRAAFWAQCPTCKQHVGMHDGQPCAAKPAPGVACSVKPAVFRGLSPEDLAKVTPLTEEQIDLALLEGYRARLSVQNAKPAPGGEGDPLAASRAEADQIRRELGLDPGGQYDPLPPLSRSTIDASWDSALRLIRDQGGDINAMIARAAANIDAEHAKNGWPAPPFTGKPQPSQPLPHHENPAPAPRPDRRVCGCASSPTPKVCPACTTSGNALELAAIATLTANLKMARGQAMKYAHCEADLNAMRAERDAATASALRRGEQITALLGRLEAARTWRAKQGHMLDVEIDDIGRRACTNEANALAFDERSARATNTYAHDVNADRAGQSRQRAAFLRNLAAFLAGDDGAKGEP